MATILLTGKSGQVGFELERSLAALGTVITLDRSLCDLANPDAIRAVVRHAQPDIIVNAAAYTAVDLAEQEPELALRINGQAVEVLAEEAARLDALLVHYSTDYVFDGSKAGAYTEEDPTAPLSAYGRSKLAGEQAIHAIGPPHLIFRTSWVFGTHGNNFLKTVLRLVQEREQLRMIDDQVGAPTSARLIAQVTAQAIKQWLDRTAEEPFPDGIYHLASAGETSWHGYARLVARLALLSGLPLKIKPDDIEAIPSSAYPLPARRPSNSRLDTNRLRRTFKVALPGWENDVRDVISSIGP